MDEVPLWQWTGIGLCLMLSAFFSATETALTATPPHRVRKFIREGRDGAGIMTLWMEHPNRVLSAILIGNNLVNILAAALATGIALRAFGDAGVAVATGAMTLLTLTVGEILPKSLAKSHAERLSPVLARLLLVPYRLFYPLTWFFVALVRGIVRLSGGDLPRQGLFVTPEDIRSMLEMSDPERGLPRQQRAMLHRIFEMSGKVVREVMVPRTDIVAASDELSFGELAQVAVNSGHSRIPIYHETLDNIMGLLYAKDLLKHLPEGGRDFRLGAVLRQPVYVPETKALGPLLQEFQRERRHMAIVLDEYGGTAGLITLEDVLEEIVGEIEDEFDRPGAEIVPIPGDGWSVQARVNLDELKERAGIALPAEEEEYESLGGFLIARLGKVPRKGDTLRLDGMRLTVEEATPRRVIRVRIEKARLEAPARAAENQGSP